MDPSAHLEIVVEEVPFPGEMHWIVWVRDQIRGHVYRTHFKIDPYDPEIMARAEPSDGDKIKVKLYGPHEAPGLPRTQISEVVVGPEPRWKFRSPPQKWFNDPL